MAARKKRPPSETREEILARREADRAARAKREAEIREENLRAMSSDELATQIWENVFALKDPTLRDGETEDEILQAIETAKNELVRRVDLAPSEDELVTLRASDATVDKICAETGEYEADKILAYVTKAAVQLQDLCGNGGYLERGLLGAFMAAAAEHLPHGSDARDKLHDLQRWFERGNGRD